MANDLTLIVEVKVMLRPKVIRLVCLGVKDPTGTQEQILLTVSRGFADLDALSDKKMGLWFTIVVGPRQHILYWIH
jgi:hypothetical protein